MRIVSLSAIAWSKDVEDMFVNRCWNKAADQVPSSDIAHVASTCAGSLSNLGTERKARPEPLTSVHPPLSTTAASSGIRYPVKSLRFVMSDYLCVDSRPRAKPCAVSLGGAITSRTSQMWNSADLCLAFRILRCNLVTTLPERTNILRTLRW